MLTNESKDVCDWKDRSDERKRKWNDFEQVQIGQSKMLSPHTELYCLSDQTPVYVICCLSVASISCMVDISQVFFFFLRNLFQSIANPLKHETFGELLVLTVSYVMRLRRKQNTNKKTCINTLFGF